MAFLLESSWLPARESKAPFSSNFSRNTYISNREKFSNMKYLLRLSISPNSFPEPFSTFAHCLLPSLLSLLFFSLLASTHGNGKPNSINFCVCVCVWKGGMIFVEEGWRKLHYSAAAARVSHKLCWRK